MSEPFLRNPSGILIDLPDPLRQWLGEMATEAGRDAVDPGGAVHRRLLGPIDPTADHDDPLIELQRQFGVEGSLSILLATVNATEINEEEAEQWIRALQLILAATAARLSVLEEDDIAGLDQEGAQTLTTLQALISLMIDALDA